MSKFKWPEKVDDTVFQNKIMICKSLQPCCTAVLSAKSKIHHANMLAITAC